MIGPGPQSNQDSNAIRQDDSQSRQSRQRNILVDLNAEKMDENGLLSVVSEHASNAEASSLSYARSI